MDDYNEPQTNGLGLASFIVSLVGVLFCGGLLCPIGVIMAMVALSKPPKGFAIAGLVIGLIGSLWILGVIAILILASLGVAVGLGAALFGGLFGIPFFEIAMDANTIKTQAVSYLDDNGTFPDSLDALTFSKAETTEDPWGETYRYEIGADQRSATLTSSGPDKAFDTSDDIVVTFSRDDFNIQN